MSYNLNKANGILSISHIDLDGISCQIVIKNILDKKDRMTRMNINYDKIDEYLKIVYEFCSYNKPSHCFITDLSFNINQLEKLNKIAERLPDTMFIFIDHHPFEEEYKHLNRDNLKIILTSLHSATKLTYMFLSKYVSTDCLYLEEYVNNVNAYDIWLKDTSDFKVGFVYNELFWQYKMDYYWSKFKNNFKLSMNDKDLYKSIIKKKLELWDKLEKSGRIFKADNDIFMIFTDDFSSHVTIDYPGFKTYIIISSTGTVSVRLNRDFDLTGIREKIFNELEKMNNILNYGGHHEAFGIKLKNTEPNDIIKFAKSFINVVSSAVR